jgi:hypothetical protein
MLNFAQKSIFGEFFLRKDSIYHETYFIKKPVKMNHLFTQITKTAHSFDGKLAPSVEKVKSHWTALEA